MRPLLCWISVALASYLAPSAANQTKDKPMREPHVITVADKDKDGKFALHVGDLLVVRLEAPLTGYVWRITRNRSDLLRPLERAPAGRLGKSPPSSVELQVFHLKAEKAGSGDLELEYGRPADKDVKAANSFQVHFTIEP